MSSNGIFIIFITIIITNVRIVFGCLTSKPFVGNQAGLWGWGAGKRTCST